MLTILTVKLITEVKKHQRYYKTCSPICFHTDCNLFLKTIANLPYNEPLDAKGPTFHCSNSETLNMNELALRWPPPPNACKGLSQTLSALLTTINTIFSMGMKKKNAKKETANWTRKERRIRRRTWEVGVVSSVFTLLRLIFSNWSLLSSGTLYTTAPIPLRGTRKYQIQNKTKEHQEPCKTHIKSAW